MKQTSNAKLLWGLAATLCFLFGLIMLPIGCQQSALRSATEGPPTPMTLSELAENGPGENRFIQLTGFAYSDEFVFEEATGGTWTRAYVPMFLPGKRAKPVAIAELKGGGEEGITKTVEQTSLRGLVSARPKLFRATVAQMLRDKHPGMQADDTFYMIDQVAGQSSGDGGLPIAYIAAGILFCLGGVLTVLAVRQ